MILCIESATGVCSVVLCDHSGVLYLRESGDDRAHSKLLATFVDEVLKAGGTTASRLDAVAVSKGPGSYTGLRIGVSMAKGLAYGGSVPLISVDTLHSMYYTLIASRPELINAEPGTHFIPMIDARRMEVYHSVISSTGETVREAAALVLDENSFSDLLGKGKVIFFGNGADKSRDLIKHPNALFIDHIYPSAAGMCALAHKSLKEGIFEDVAYFEPYYLKDFLATVPKKMLP